MVSDTRSIKRAIDQLDGLKTRFDNQATVQKSRLMNQLKKSEITNPERLQQYHDTLCFIRAYPDNAKILSLVENELKTFGNRIKRYRAKKHDPSAENLIDTGITGTYVSHEFSYELIRSLSEWYGGNVEIDWQRYDDKETDSISTLLPLLVAWQENDTLDNDYDITTDQWLKFAKSSDDKSLLAVFLKLLACAPISDQLRASLYDNAEIPVKWTLGNCPASRTLKRIKSNKVFYQKEKLIGRSGDLRATLAARQSSVKLLSAKAGDQYVRHIKEVLGVRCRELYPLINAEPREVYINNPGRGIELAIYGDKLGVRLPLESNFGAMLLRNGMPVGYGVGSMLFDRVEIAINVFPSYRSGESAFIIEQFFRLFYHHFQARVFLVRSYQVGGDDNEEALSSGSFWFYYKLGFRPVDRSIRKLARHEYEKIKSDRSYRTSMRTLKRLAQSDIFFCADPAKMTAFRELPLKNLGYVITRYIARDYLGDRAKVIEHSIAKLSRILPLGNMRKWSADQQIALQRLTPLVLCIPGLARWSKQEKAGLVEIIKAKGEPQARQYVLLCNEHPRFRQAIEKLAFSRKK